MYKITQYNGTYCISINGFVTLLDSTNFRTSIFFICTINSSLLCSSKQDAEDGVIDFDVAMHSTLLTLLGTLALWLPYDHQALKCFKFNTQPFKDVGAGIVIAN